MSFLLTFLRVNLPADRCRLNFPLPGRHGGDLRHGRPCGDGAMGDEDIGQTGPGERGRTAEWLTPATKATEITMDP